VLTVRRRHGPIPRISVQQIPVQVHIEKPASRHEPAFEAATAKACRQGPQTTEVLSRRSGLLSCEPSKSTVEGLKRPCRPRSSIPAALPAACRQADASRPSRGWARAGYRVREGAAGPDEKVVPRDGLESSGTPILVDNGLTHSHASTILRRVPPPNRSGTTTTAASAICGRRSGTSRLARFPDEPRPERCGAWTPISLSARSGCTLAMCGRSSGRSTSRHRRWEVASCPRDHGAGIRRRIRGARPIILDIPQRWGSRGSALQGPSSRSRRWSATLHRYTPSACDKLPTPPAAAFAS